jgi:NAD(P) transhydrogenase
VHTGTLPSKTLREAAIYLSGYHCREMYGVAVELTRDATLRTLMHRTGQISEVESRRIRENLIFHGVTYVEGHGRFEDPHTIVVDGPAPKRLRGEFVLIATGSKPYRPEGIPFESPNVHDSDEVLQIECIPRSLTIVGAGVIGCEYACTFAALGVEVILLDQRSALLPFLDHEMVERLTHAMERLGVKLQLGQAWASVEETPEGVVTHLEGGGRVVTQQLLYAAGRVGQTRDLGLERVGLAPTSRGLLEVDDGFATTVPHVLAAGDVIGFPALASTSMEQGRVAVCRAFGFGYKQAVSSLLPYGIYTIPEVSAVGETEHGAIEKGIDYVVGRALYRNNARGLIQGDLEGVTKLLVERPTRRLLGVHVVGERASELVHIGQTAMVAGAKVDVFIDMVFNFPTLAESYKYAAYDCLAALSTARPDVRRG